MVVEAMMGSFCFDLIVVNKITILSLPVACYVVPPNFVRSRSKVAAVGQKVQKGLPKSAQSSIKIPNSMPQARASPEKDMWETALKTELG